MNNKISNILTALLIVILCTNIIFVGCSKEFYGYRIYAINKSTPIRFSFEYPSNYRFIPHADDVSPQYIYLWLKSPYIIKEKNYNSATSRWEIEILNYIPYRYKNAEEYFQSELERWQIEKDIQIVKQTTREIDGMQANEIVFFYLEYITFDNILGESVGGPYPARKIAVYFENDGIIYEFVSASFEDFADQDMIHFQRMLDTFKIIN